MPRNSHNNNRPGIALFGRRLSSTAFRKLLTVIIAILLVFLLMVWRIQPARVSLSVGDRCMQTITADRAAVYVDGAETERLRKEAVQKVADVYNPDPKADADAQAAISQLFAATDAIRRQRSLDAAALEEHAAAEDEAPSTDAVPPPPQDYAADLRRQAPQEFAEALDDDTGRLLIEMAPDTYETVRAATARIVADIMATPIHNYPEDRGDLENARGQAQETAARRPDLSPQMTRAVARLSAAVLRHNRIHDAEATQQARTEAAALVKDVLRQLQPGDLIIRPKETVTETHIAMFQALGLMQSKRDYVQSLALLGLLLGLVIALALYVLRFARQAYDDQRLFHVLCASIVIAVLVIRLLEGSTHYPAWVLTTVTALAVFIASVIGPQVAIAASIFVAMLIGLIAATGGDARLLVSAAVCGMAATYVIPASRTKTTVLTRAAISIALINPIVLSISNKVFGMGITSAQLGVAAAGGLASAIMAVGAVTIIQRPLKLVNEMRLIELLNPNEPLLKRMLTEGPGSYQSSVMVANLAEPAAEAIAANGLLTRVCCMYHDIGKLKRPSFFTENQFGTESPHDHLSSHLSALVLISHVKEGIEIAREAGLPAEIIAVIPEHHGTTLVSYLYRKAVSEADDPDEVREIDFRYDGPKPQSKETAIIMLADTVEAAARTMDDPTPTRITELVDRLVEAKIEDGQMDEAPLTFADITTIKQSFTNTLTRMFHHRTRYPDSFLPENIRGLTGPDAPQQGQTEEGEPTPAS